MVVLDIRSSGLCNIVNHAFVTKSFTGSLALRLSSLGNTLTTPEN